MALAYSKLDVWVTRGKRGIEQVYRSAKYSSAIGRLLVGHFSLGVGHPREVPVP